MGRAHRQEHEVQRPVANDLIRNVRAIAGLRVVSLSGVGHRWTFCMNRLDERPTHDVTPAAKCGAKQRPFAWGGHTVATCSYVVIDTIVKPNRGC